MPDFRDRFEQATTIDDEVERSWAIEALCNEAEEMSAAGHEEDALALFELIHALGPDDDLNTISYDIARRALIEAGKLTLTPLPEVILTLEQEYASLPPREKLLAIARTLHRTCQDDYPETNSEVLRLLDAAHQLAPLNDKDRKFRMSILGR